MKAKFRFAVLVLACCQLLVAGENNGRGVRAIALGNSFVAIANEPWAIHYNPAGLMQIPSYKGSAFFVPQQFGLDELKTIAVAGVVPTSLATFGLGVEQFGFELYKETTISLAAAMTIDWDISAGITANLHRLSIERYGSRQSLTFDIGLMADATNNLRFGFNAKNITAATIGATKERLPQVIQTGAAYAPLEGFLITVELEKDVRHDLIVKGGIEQILFDMLVLRAGVSNNPDKFSVGMGVKYSGFEFGYAGYSHPFLGWTHHMEVSFTFETSDE
jgi:hypothetical protein